MAREMLHGRVGQACRSPAYSTHAATPRSRPLPLCRRGGAWFLFAAMLMLLIPRNGPSNQAVTLHVWPDKYRGTMLLSRRGYELWFRPPPKGGLLPRLQLREVPPRPISFRGLVGSIEGGADQKELLGFPFTTKNGGTLQIGFPVIDGKLALHIEDPPASLGDDDEGQRVAEVSYDQTAPGIGEIGAKVKSTGEWSTSFARDVEEIGHLSGGVNSQLDWSVDLATTYPTYKGVAPSVTYGATHDGIRVLAKLDGTPAKNVHSSYTVQNLPGKYAPLHFLHDAKVTYSSGRVILEATGAYNRKFPKSPVQGSLTATTEFRPVTLTASVDSSRYRLLASTRFGQVAAAVDREAPEVGGKRHMEVELKLGNVSALATKLGTKKPRVLFGFGI